MAQRRHTTLPINGVFSESKTVTSTCEITPQAIAANPFIMLISPRIELSLSSPSKPSLWISATSHASKVVKSSVVHRPPRARPKKRTEMLPERTVRQETE